MIAEINVYRETEKALFKPLESFMTDPMVSEILINKPKEVYIEKHGEFTRHNIEAITERKMASIFRTIAVSNKQEEKQIFYGSMTDQSRITLIAPPTASHHSLSIRRKVVKNMTLNNYRENDYYKIVQPASREDDELSFLDDSEKDLIELYKQGNWNDFVPQAIKQKKNIIIAGGTSSGKTTFLNACLQEIDMNDRIISLEDTRELDVVQPNYVSLLETKAEGDTPAVPMRDLVKACLRLRPDRIIMGEMRGAEIMDFVTACSTGHEGGLSTIHANNPRNAFMRMSGMYKQNNVVMTDADIMRELESVVDVIIQIGKTPHGRLAQSIFYKYGHLDLK